MIHLMNLLVASSAVILITLVLRLVQPELFYSVLRAVTRIKMTKAFLEYDANRIMGPEVFPNLLINDFRMETRYYDENEANVLMRVNKIREMYRLLVSSRPVAGLARELRPQILIDELTGLIEGLTRNVLPEESFYRSTVDASALLGLIGNRIRESEALPPLNNAREVEAWLTANPMTFQQVVEILIAAVFGLAYRQRVPDNSLPESAPSAEVVEEKARTRGQDDRLDNVGAVRDAKELGTEDGSGNIPSTIPEPTRQPDPRSSAVGLAERSTGSGTSYSGGELVIRIFVSYSHRDKKYLKDNSLLGYLRGLEQEGVEFWYDEEITAGEKWDEKIKTKIASSDIALILVSQAYLDSEYCRNVEIKRFLADAELRGLFMLPIMLSQCEWERHEWLKERRFLPGEGQTIENNYTRSNKRSNLFHDIRQHLRRQIESIRSGYRHPQAH